MVKNAKDRAQKPKDAATAPAAAGSETEEEVPVTELPLIPVVTGSARAASMTWDEDYPTPETSEAEKRAEEKAEARANLRAERRNRPDSTPDSEEEEKEYQEEQRKQAGRRRINKPSPPTGKRVDHAKVARRP
ncbi:hypothetical protein DYB30_013597 [Aphanomyces astaci]|uniref:Uncharacterized protein n=1 Tax=Aphanomyces astaci TaxID=112090 RepID=A0A397E6F6_APHAT|nr:hypothetical protein DYB30_013597 [Aphanomyces astaci]